MTPRAGQFTQEDPIGLAGGLNLYGFAGGDPVNFSDPFGLCKDEQGNERKCTVKWAKEARDTTITAETKAAIQQLADLADVDLVLSSGRRAKGSDCSKSRHNCGKAVDIKSINGVDVGQGHRANPAAAELVERVQGIAFGMSETRENFGPLGIWKRNAPGGAWQLRGGIFEGGSVPWFADPAAFGLWQDHQNHVHISIQ